jgi:hypothetical protein
MATDNLGVEPDILITIDGSHSGTHFQTCRSHDVVAFADLEIGDTAGLETCGTGPGQATPRKAGRRAEP